MWNILAISMPSVPELLVVLVIVLIFVGAGKLPDVAAAMGKSIRNFKEGMRGDALDVTPDRTDRKGLDEPARAAEAEEIKHDRVSRG